MREDGIEYADRLSESGVSVRHEHFSEIIHGFAEMFTYPKMIRGHEAVAGICDDLREAPR